MAIPNSDVTLDLIFEQVKDAPEKQLKDVTALDAKCIQVFAGASVILGAGALIDTRHGGTWPTVLVGAALIVYLVVALLSFMSLKTIKLHGSRYADTLWADFKDDSPETIKRAIVKKVGQDYAYNQTLIARKATWLDVGLLLTAIEAICIAGAVLGSRLNA